MWTTEIEASWASLFCAILNALRLLMAPAKKDASCGDSGSEFGDPEAEGDASDSSSSSTSIIPPMASFDRHLVLIGCQSFQSFFDRHPQILSHFDKFNAIEIDGVLVSSALKMHSSRVLAIVEDIVENTGNPEKIRTLLQDLGRHHYRYTVIKVLLFGYLLMLKLVSFVMAIETWNLANLGLKVGYASLKLEF